MPLDEVCVLEGSLEGLCLFVVHLRVKSQFPVKLNLQASRNLIPEFDIIHTAIGCDCNCMLPCVDSLLRQDCSLYFSESRQ